MHARTLRAVESIAMWLSLIVGCASAQQSLRELFERARMLDEANQNLTEAVKLYSQVAAQSKDDRALAAKAQYQVALLYERLGRKAQAQRAFRAVVSQYPDQIDIVQRAKLRISAEPAGTKRLGPTGLRLSDPPREAELHLSKVYEQWLNRHPEIIRDYGAPKVAKFVSVHEQPFDRGLVFYNVTDGWSVWLFRQGDSGGTFKKLTNGENLAPAVGLPKVDERVFEEITKGLSETERDLHWSLVDSRVSSPGAKGIGIIGGIATLYIENRFYDGLGPPTENESGLHDIVYVMAERYELLVGYRHSVDVISVL